MTLIVHVLSALGSLGVATYTGFRPSKAGLYSTGFSTGITVVTGVVTAVSTSADIARACISGLVYLIYICALTYIAVRKLRIACP